MKLTVRLFFFFDCTIYSSYNAFNLAFTKIYKVTLLTWRTIQSTHAPNTCADVLLSFCTPSSSLSMVETNSVCFLPSKFRYREILTGTNKTIPYFKQQIQFSSHQLNKCHEHALCAVGDFQNVYVGLNLYSWRCGSLNVKEYFGLNFSYL